MTLDQQDASGPLCQTLRQRPGIHVAPKQDFRLRPADFSPTLTREALLAAANEISSWPAYTPTPLKALSSLARHLGVASIRYKDESTRFGLGSFKALGGAYAVMRVLQRLVRVQDDGSSGSRTPSAGDRPDVRGTATVTCATDGNHGRSVAWGARTFGCRCVIYIHEHVSQGRADAIASYGAEVRRVPGNYDDAVRRAAADAARNGWHVVSDTSYEGYTDVPRDVMQGYGVMVQECVEQLDVDALSTHVFIQGGVGGLAAAVTATLHHLCSACPPTIIVVEPERAACLFRSAVAGHPVTVEGELDTIMAGLACGEPSLLAWQILETGADAFMTIEDDAAVEAMRYLAGGGHGDPPIVAGESAVAGLAALMQACAHPDLRDMLGLTARSHILLFGTEGATDPDLYAALVGKPASEVLGG